MESAESLKLKQETKANLRKDLYNSDFDTDTIDKILEVFDVVVADYKFQRRSMM